MNSIRSISGEVLGTKRLSTKPERNAPKIPSNPQSSAVAAERNTTAKVKVNFVAGVSQIRNLSPDEFTVITDYLEIEQKESDKCNLYLRDVPQGISRATLSIKQVDYLIEDEE